MNQTDRQILRTTKMRRACALSLALALAVLATAEDPTQQAAAAAQEATPAAAEAAPPAAGEAGAADIARDPYVDLKLDLQQLEDDDEEGVGEGYYGDDDLAAEFHMDDFAPSHVFTFPLDRRQECFFEDVASAPIKLRGSYFVASGSSQEVNVVVSHVINLDHDKEEVLLTQTARNEGNFHVVAKVPGQYKVCFGNPSRANKRVTFALHVGVRKREVAEGSEISPLEEALREAHHDLRDLVAEKNFLIARVRRHMLVEDSIEYKVSSFTILESVCMLAVTLGQVFYIQRLIENRQWV